MFYALDFESEAIDTRPNYPPKPVGLAIATATDNLNEYASEYLAWGHPIENNCDEAKGKLAVEALFRVEENRFVFHNAPFDCSIIEEKWNIKVPWDRVHDTMLMAFLHDPYGELSLKPLAERYLGIPPTERDAVRDWLISKGICRANQKDWGAHISKAPGNLVGTYAKGDTTRTLELFYFLRAKLETRGMV
jgi:hypothetical protein